jgi:hypothetical protein
MRVVFLTSLVMVDAMMEDDDFLRGVADNQVAVSFLILMDTWKMCLFHCYQLPLVYAICCMTWCPGAHRFPTCSR